MSDKVRSLELDVELLKKQVQKLQDELNRLNERINQCFNQIGEMRRLGKEIAKRLAEI